MFVDLKRKQLLPGQCGEEIQYRRLLGYGNPRVSLPPGSLDDPSAVAAAAGCYPSQLSSARAPYHALAKILNKV